MRSRVVVSAPFGKDAARAARRRAARSARSPRAVTPGSADDRLGGLLVEDLAALRRVALAPEVEVHDQHAARLEPGVDALRVASGCAGTGRRRPARRARARPATTTSTWRSAKKPRRPRWPGAGGHELVLEHRHDVRLRCLHRRREAEEEPVTIARIAVNASTRPSIARSSCRPGSGSGRSARDERVEQPVGEQQRRGRRRAQRQQHALGEQLPDEPQRARRRARAGARSPCAGAAARAEQQVGDVRAGDQQHDADDGHQDHRELHDAARLPALAGSAARRAAAPRRRSVPCCRPGTPARAGRRPSSGWPTPARR